MVLKICDKPTENENITATWQEIRAQGKIKMTIQVKCDGKKTLFHSVDPECGTRQVRVIKVFKAIYLGDFCVNVQQMYK